jgi:F5/8 type C domain
MRLRPTILLAFMLSLFLLVPVSSEAATKLTLLGVTQEEVNIWNTRRVSGPYKSDWDTLTSRANAWVSAPDGRWSGQTSGCWDNNSRGPGRSQDRGMRDAGLMYLLTGSASYLNAVRTQLLAQAATAGTNFANSSVWCTPNNSNNWYENMDFEFGTWLERLLLAYDYTRSAMSPSDQATLDTWFLNAANYVNTILNNTLSSVFSGRLSDNYTCAGYCPGEYHGITHFGGYNVYTATDRWNNITHTGANFFADVGIMQGNTALKNSAKRYFAEWLKYGVFPDGTINEQHRWDNNDTDCGANPPCPPWGFAYPGAQVGTMIRIADHFGRNGDTSLYDMTTTEGFFGTESPGNPKSLLKVLQNYSRMTTGAVTRYASTTATANSALVIDTFSSTYDAYHFIHYIAMAPANMYYKDSTVSAGYQFPLVTPYFSGGYDPLGGDWGTWPMVLGMYGQMEGLVNPYGGTITPAPTLVLAASPVSITSGQTATLNWSATNATSCTASGGWTGTKAISGSETVSPTVTTTYILSCSTASQSVSVAVNSIGPPTGSLANSLTMTATSQNFAVDHPVEHLWDGCVDGTSTCTSGNSTASSFWIEFDLQKLYDLSTARVFGDADENWVSNSWTLMYKNNSTDPWTTAFANSNAFGNQWFSRDLAGVKARYIRVEVNGSIVGTQARELEIYGTVSTSSPPYSPTALTIQIGN